jgi:hypothetical protein
MRNNIFNIKENPPIPIKFKYAPRQPGYKEISLALEQIIKKVLKISNGDGVTQSGIEVLASNITSSSRYCINEKQLSSFINVNIGFCEKESAELAREINTIRSNHPLLKPICDSDYKDVEGFSEKAADFLVEIGIWEMKDGSINECDLEWDLEYFPILWRARYVDSYNEFFDLYQTVWIYMLSIKLGKISNQDCPRKIWDNIDAWKSIKWRVEP